jgi:CDP-diacylglycerol--glycerol-3-phosphate 3-phosphatidyltransferase
MVESVASWANAVTVSRLLLSPLMFWAIPSDGQGSWIAFFLWFVLCASDGIDGYIARKRGPTAVGAFLDPLADKVLVLGAMFTLVSTGVFPWVPVVLIAAREVVISVYRVVLGGKGISVPAKKLAKYKTVVQQFAVAFAVLPWTVVDATWLWTTLLWISVALTLITGFQYLRSARSAQEASQREHAVS